MAWLLFVDLVMLTRLACFRSDTPSSAGLVWSLCALQIAFLGLFAASWRLALLAAALVAITGLGRLALRRAWHPAGVQALTFLATLGAAALLTGTAGLAPWVQATLPTAPAGDHGWTALVVAFGVLLLTNEVNFGIRYGFHRLALEPKVEPAEAAEHGYAPAATDQRQYNAGRVIGILERYLVFTLLLAGADYGAIALILAAKGFARFKQLDRREFAEYILIGTLASTLAAVLVARLVAALL